MVMKRYQIADSLRNEGKTFKEIGEVLGVGTERARQMVLAAKTAAAHSDAWTAGLNARLVKMLSKNGFRNRDEIRAAFRNGNIHKIAKLERGIGPAALAELYKWLDPVQDDNATSYTKEISDAIVLLERNGFSVRKNTVNEEK